MQSVPVAAPRGPNADRSLWIPWLVLLTTAAGCGGGGEARYRGGAVSVDGAAAAGTIVGEGAGGLQVSLAAPTYSRARPAPIDYRLEPPVRLDRVDLWTTTDGGRSWTLSTGDPDCRSPVLLNAPDGEYGLWIAASAPGAALPRPRSGDRPQARIVIDSLPPEIELADFRAARSGGAARTIDLRAGFRVRDAHLDPEGARIEWMTPGGRWTSVPGGPGAPALEAASPAPGQIAGEAFLTVPEPAEEPLHLRLTVSDRAGNSASRLEEIHLLDLVEPPRLEFQSLDDGGVYRGGSAVEIRVRADWPRLAPGGLALAVSSDGGRTWQPLARGIDPAVPFAWTLPSAGAEEVVLELSARGRCGYTASRRSRPFRVDAQPPQASILGPRRSQRGAVRLSVRARDVGPAGLERLELYARAQDETAVRKVGEFPPGEEIEFEAERAGVLGLWLVGIDRVGNGGRVPTEGDAAEFTLEVAGQPAEEPDRPASAAAGPERASAPPAGAAAEAPADGAAPAALELKNFHDGHYRGGDRRYIFWKFTGAAEKGASVAILASADGGDTWRPVARGLPAELGRHAWELPCEPGTALRMRLRLEARGSGLDLRAGSRGQFVVDARVPRARFLGPRISRSARTVVRFALLAPEGAGTAGDEPPLLPVARVECHVRRGPGERWTLAGERNLDPDEGRRALPGRDPEGAERALGAPSSAGGPRVGPSGGFGGRGDPIPRGADEDGPPGLPVEEEGLGIAALIEDGRYEVALIAEDAVGNRAALPPPGERADGGELLVDTVRPRLQVTVEGRKDIYAGGETISLAIRAQDENLPEFPVTIEAEGESGETETVPSPAGRAPSPDRSPEGRGEGAGWTLLERYFPRDRSYGYRVPKTGGPRRLRIAALDLAGNRAEEVIAFTVVPPGPQVRLLGFEGRRVVRGGETIPIRWETSGAEGEGVSVALSLSRDGGRSWSEVARDLPNQGLFSLNAPQEDIQDLRVRVEVTGAAGQVASAESPRIAVSWRAPRVILESVEPGAPEGKQDD